jgi:ABC-type branched-subunit amino acid transport system substrate-binding protein
MRLPTTLLAFCAACALSASLAACGKKVEEKDGVPGVDPARKVISLGALNDESGPAKQLGVMIANGKRLLAKAVAAGAVKLPDGWTIELVERDHGYSPQQAVQLYKELRDRVLFFTTSLGTGMTLPLVEDLKRDDVLAFPATLSSVMAKNEHTPPLGPGYNLEAMRAMDWVVESAGGAGTVKAAIVHQRDDYGGDGVDGWKAAAAHHKVTIVAEEAVKPGEQDFTTAVKALKDAGATHVMMTVLPGATSGILGAAAKLSYAPVWIGNTASWIDAFFEKLPPAIAASYHWATGLTYWGEDVPGMKEFLEVWKAHGAGMGEPSYVILFSYTQGLSQLEALRRAIEAKQIDRAGVKRALHTIAGWNAGGLIQPIDLTKVPYVTGRRTRILAPDFERKSWKPIADWAAPKALPGS